MLERLLGTRLFSLHSYLLDALFLYFIFLISLRCCCYCCCRGCFGVAVRLDFDYSGNPYRGRRLLFEIILTLLLLFNLFTSPPTLQPSLCGVLLLINCD